MCWLDYSTKSIRYRCQNIDWSLMTWIRPKPYQKMVQISTVSRQSVDSECLDELPSKVTYVGKTQCHSYWN